MINTKPSIQEIVDRGTAIYEKIKDKYEPQNNGKYLAIEIESEKQYMAETGGEALERATQEHPDKFFFFLRIGFSAADILALSLEGRS